MITANLHAEKAKPFRTSIHLKKALGQHFLRDHGYVERIVGAISGSHPIVEIGPGDGALTQELFRRGLSVTAIELDAEMIPVLKRRFHRQKDTFNLVVADAVRVDWAALFREIGIYSIAGNLPYNAASQILFHIFDTLRVSRDEIISEAVITVQKEVAERLTAKPGDKSYGALTILTNYHAETQYLFTIPASSFFPKPKVDGGVVRLRFRKPGEFPHVDYASLRRIVKGCFAQRRKILGNSLRVVNDLPEYWRQIPVDWSKRPEQLSPDEYVDLTARLIELGLNSAHQDVNNQSNDVEDTLEEYS